MSLILIYHWLALIPVSQRIPVTVNCEFYASACLVLGRSIAIHSDVTPSEIIACANIEPDVISDMTVQLTFPIPADNGIDVR